MYIFNNLMQAFYDRFNTLNATRLRYLVVFSIWHDTFITLTMILPSIPYATRVSEWFNEPSRSSSLVYSRFSRPPPNDLGFPTSSSSSSSLRNSVLHPFSLSPFHGTCATSLRSCTPFATLTIT